MDKGIIFCGFMGAGKSRIGRLAAIRLGFHFEDLDEVISESLNESISSIFLKYGEPYFRKLEKKMLLSRIDEKSRILSLGGGTLQNQQIVDLIKEKNLLVFISPPFDEIVKRVSGNEKRPLVLDKNGNPKTFDVLYDDLWKLYTDRLKFYDQAHIKVETDPSWDSYQSTNYLIQFLKEYDYQV